MWLISTDASGNQDSCSITVSITDAIAPSITCPSNQNVSFDATCQYALLDYTGLTTGADNCGTVSFTQSPVAGTLIGGTTTITMTADDGNGNTTQCTFDVIPVDNDVPNITCPTVQTVVGDASCQISIIDYTLMAVVTDNCDANSIVTQSPLVGTVVGEESNTVWIYATDLAGNVDSCSFEVIVSDTIAPIITCLPSQTEYLDVNCEISLPDYGSIMTSSDNCDANLTITQIPESGTVYNGEQEVPVEVTFTDEAGNASSCTFITSVSLDENSGCDGRPIIATLLTPNGDGKNDRWIIRETNYIRNCTVMVFNRWGQKVYESTGYDNSWTGTSEGGADLPDGAYYYVISCEEDVNYTGPVTILRTNK